jgi:glyoxylase-like metal-dependent hydrolase (beta-lactamase superfamily II)
MTGQEFFKTGLIGEDIWSISGPANDQMYLVAGKDKALLVDTGMGVGDLAALVRSLTPLPVIVVNTHGHPDHAGGNGGFDEYFLHPADEPIMKKMCADEYRWNDLKAFHGDGTPAYQRMAAVLVSYRETRLNPLKEGMYFDLGGRVFEVMEVPGHTPGCVCIINENEGIIFTGDMIVETPVWLYLSHSLPLSIYLASLQKIQKKRFNTLLPGHLPAPLGRENLEDLVACAEEILANPGVGKTERTFAGEGLLWKYGRASIIYNLLNLHD